MEPFFILEFWYKNWSIRSFISRFSTFFQEFNKISLAAWSWCFRYNFAREKWSRWRQWECNKIKTSEGKSALRYFKGGSGDSIRFNFSVAAIKRGSSLRHSAKDIVSTKRWFFFRRRTIRKFSPRFHFKVSLNILDDGFKFLPNVIDLLSRGHFPNIIHILKM